FVLARYPLESAALPFVLARYPLESAAPPFVLARYPLESAAPPFVLARYPLESAVLSFELARYPLDERDLLLLNLVLHRSEYKTSHLHHLHPDTLGNSLYNSSFKNNVLKLVI